MVFLPIGMICSGPLAVANSIHSGAGPGNSQVFMDCRNNSTHPVTGAAASHDKKKNQRKKKRPFTKFHFLSFQKKDAEAPLGFGASAKNSSSSKSSRDDLDLH